MRPVAVVGWVILVVGTAVLGMRTVGFLDPRVDRVEMVSRGTTAGDPAEGATLETTRSIDVPPDVASRAGIVAVAIGILLVVLGSPGAAPSERRLIGT
jgi:hypothetical protein